MRQSIRALLFAFCLIGLSSVASAKAASPNIAEWDRYTNGMSGGTSQTFTADAGFHFVHIGTFDVALNGPFTGTVILELLRTYDDGSMDDSGQFLFATEPTLFVNVPAAYWENPLASGKKLKSVTVQVVGAPVNATTIVLLHGFEY